MRTSEILKRLQEMGYSIQEKPSKGVRNWIMVISENQYGEPYISGYLNDRRYYIYGHYYDNPFEIIGNFREALRLLYRQIINERLHI